MKIKEMLSDTEAAGGWGYASKLSDFLHEQRMGPRGYTSAHIAAVAVKLAETDELFCSLRRNLAPSVRDCLHDYVGNPIYRAAVRDRWAQCFAELVNRGPFTPGKKWARDRAKQTRLEVVRAIRAMRATRTTPRHQPRAAAPRRPACQRGASPSSTTKSGDSNDPDPDPDPATNPHPHPHPRTDPDPDDCTIPDPHAYINTNPAATPENRILRKAILAQRNPPKNPTKAYAKAHDYYVAHALHNIGRAMQHMLSRKHTLTHRDMDHIPPAAHRLFARLVESHDLEQRPNPVIRGSTGLVATLAFRTTDGLQKYARGGPYAQDASARKADIRLGKSLGLFPPGEKSWGDALGTDMVVHHEDCANVRDDANDPLHILLEREAEALADAAAPPEQAGRSHHLVQMPGTLDTMLTWLCDLPAPLLDNLVQAHRSGGVDVLSCLAAQCGYGDSAGNLKKGIATRAKNAQGRFGAGCVSVAQQLLALSSGAA